MTTLKFDTREVLRCVDHAIAAPEQNQSYSETFESGTATLVLVKDTGIYLMSNGAPRDIVKEGRSFVAYAVGYDPRAAEEYDGQNWDKCRAAVGGDDFAEYFTLDPQAVAALRNGGRLRIKMTATQYTIMVDGPRAQADVEVA